MAAQWDLVKAAAKAWRGPAARATLRGVAAGLLGIPRMLRKRDAIQAARTVDRLTLERLMQPPYEMRVPMPRQAPSPPKAS